jgi:selenide,water dikinase
VLRLLSGNIPPDRISDKRMRKGGSSLTEDKRLTVAAKAAGCASKLSPVLLDSVLSRLPKPNDPRLIVGVETSDDAGVYLLDADRALVQTVDFFTPMVDDPYGFGGIAAANALSDVYAMGGVPLTALTIVAFPTTGSVELLEKILLGGLAKMEEAHCRVLGGHSVRDDDLKFGYAVTGLIDPGRVWRNVGAKPGDVLIFTKPLGTGVISTALKQGKATAEWVEASAKSMLGLNRYAAEALRSLEENFIPGGSPVHAVTDVTGFSLLGHSREMAHGSGVSLMLRSSAISFLPGALEAAHAGFLPGGLRNNQEFVGSCAGFHAGVTEEVRSLLFDPQTSGGLLIALDPAAQAETMERMKQRGIDARHIGEVVPKRSPLIEVS